MACRDATIFAMSITPYINASIILQLLTVAIPALERMAKDGGEEGREERSQRWTRYLGVLLGLLQGLSVLRTAPQRLRRQDYATNTGALAVRNASLLTFTAGTALIMWMGEHITPEGHRQRHLDHPVRRYRFPRSVAACVRWLTCSADRHERHRFRHC